MLGGGTGMEEGGPAWDALTEGPPCGRHFPGPLHPSPQTKRLKTTQMYSFKTPETKVQNQGVS